MSEPIFSDEVLMAYADGELPETEASAVRKVAMQDPAIAGRIAMFEASRRVLSAAFDPVLGQPVPQRLNEAIQALGRDDITKRRDRRRGWSGVIGAWRGGWMGGWPQQALAASVACFISAVIAFWAGGGYWRQNVSGSLASEVASLPASLAGALDRLPSGQRANARLGGGAADLLPIASYKNGDSLCREFEISRPSSHGAQAVRGVVCRSDGRWQLRAVADLAASKPAGDEYRPASGGDDLAPMLGLGRSLSQQEEAELLSSGWRLR